MSVWSVLIYVFLFGFLAVAGIIGCGNPHSDNLLGRASYFLQATFPIFVSRTLESLGLSWVLRGLLRVFECCFLRRNPIVMIGYCVLVFGGFAAFIIKGYPHIPNEYLAGWHRWSGIVVMLWCAVSFALAAFTDPGIINRSNLREFSTLPFDGLLYIPTECRSCKIIKVPRSKHCRMMGKCVAKYDHFCIWINQPVAERNYRWFLSYLISHTFMLLYGAVATLTILASKVNEMKLWEKQFVNSRTGETMNATWGVIFQFLMATNQELVLIQALTGVMGVVMVFFTGYHLWLAISNVTTNETFKYAAINAHRDHMIAEAPEGAPLPPAIRNPFYRSMWLNILEVVFPLSLRSEKEWPRVTYPAPPPLTREDILMQGGSEEDVDGVAPRVSITGGGDRGGAAAATATGSESKDDADALLRKRGGAKGKRSKGSGK